MRERASAPREDRPGLADTMPTNQVIMAPSSDGGDGMVT
jgi:hypothetical protein